jgi:HK97 family phage portal protein
MWIGTALESSGYSTKSGTTITADTALNISTVYACVTILSQTIASLPMTINKSLPNGGNQIADDHYLYPILHNAFNSYQTSYEAREQGIGQLKLRGNWINRLERNNAGQIIGIWPLNPAYVTIHRAAGDIWYEYKPGGKEDCMGNRAGLYSRQDIWHIKGFSKDGLNGLSTIQCARESMGLSQALSDFSAEFFGRKAVPGNVLQHPGQLSPEARKNLKNSLEEYATTKRHTTLVLEEDMKWQSVGISNVDAQYLEISGAQVRDIARWFHMPLILLQEPDKASTYASAEQFMLSFVVHTISPDVVRIEQAANRALLSNKERAAGYYVKLNIKGLLRGDFKTRMDGYRIAREGGWYSVNDIRALEDETPIENGDIYIQPLNYKEAGEDDPEQKKTQEGKVNA